MTDEDLITQLLVGAAHHPTGRPDPAGEWVEVTSSNLHSIAVWPGGTGPEGASLAVRFHHGREYHYWAVPPNVCEALLQAASHGKCHWELIRRRNYRYLRVR